MKKFVFTSEAVAPGHPDKCCDIISDSILDAHLTQDPNARVAVETLIKGFHVVLAGEVRSLAEVDVHEVAKNALKDIGYNPEKYQVTDLIAGQSQDIAQGVDETLDKSLGAGDQGIMFGYATNETESMMPAPHVFAHSLMKRHVDCRSSGLMPFLGPDAKCQVSLTYEDGIPQRCETIVLSTQHTDDIGIDELRDHVLDSIILPTMPRGWIYPSTRILINPTGRFVLGGPEADAGVTGRKIIVDTYGGAARHGGGAFSGKDPTKVDRSAAYAARWIAKTLVYSGYADKCEVQLGYAIGISDPVSLYVDTFGTASVRDNLILELINRYFCLRPSIIIDTLELRKPIYTETAKHGHFGNPQFTWEVPNTDSMWR